jgi:cytochrome c-type biogenesis protein CcmH/NrfF
MSTLEAYLCRRITELLQQGKTDAEIIQQLQAVGGHKQVEKLLTAIKLK